RIGAFLSAANSFVPVALARFTASYPEVEVRLDQLEEPEELRRIRSGDLDLAVVFRVSERAENRRQRPDKGLDDVNLADDPYRVVLPRCIRSLADASFGSPTWPPSASLHRLPAASFPIAPCPNRSAPMRASRRTLPTK